MIIPDADPDTFTTLPLLSPEEKRELHEEGKIFPIQENWACSDFTAFDSNRLYRAGVSKIKIQWAYQ